MKMERTLLLGLDGATFQVLDALMAEGEMPFLARLAAGGARAGLRSTRHPLTPPAWTSIVTGRTPGHHGIFDFIRAAEQEGGLFFTLNTSDDVQAETLWSMVARQGGRTTSLNFPVSAPPARIPGHVIPGFVPWRHLRRAVHPAEVWELLAGLEGFDPKVFCMEMDQELKSIQYLPPEEIEPWVRLHLDRERMWFSAARALLEKDPSDLFAIVFDGVDKLQHLCWRHIDPAAPPAGDDAQRRGIRAACRQYFRELDGFLQALVEIAGPDARVFVVSDHGFTGTDDVFYANAWLEREGYLAWTDAAARQEPGRVSTDRIKSHVTGIDFTRTTAYALTPSSNGIFLRNVPAERYAAFRAELAARLTAFRDPERGHPVVSEVLLREEAFPGPFSQGAPDLTLVLHDHGFLSVLPSDVLVWRRPEPIGTHHPIGVFLASGPGVRPGALPHALSVVDVAPTVLHALGLPVPADLEGRVAEEIYLPEALRERPVRLGSPTQLPALQPAEPGLTKSDEAIVLERLQALGYIE